MIQAAREPVRPARPASVTIAFWLQLATAAVLLLLIGLMVWHGVHWDGEIDRAARVVPDANPDEVHGERIGNVVMSATLGVPLLLLAVGLAVTAPFVRQGRNAARILVFVAAGVSLLIGLGPGCAGTLFLPFALFAGPPVQEGPPDSGTDGGWGESKFITELYSNPDPADDAFLAAGLLGVGTVFVLTVAVVLLLALPPATRYFVPRPAAGAGFYPVAAQPFPYVSNPAGNAVPAVAPGYMICPDPALHLAHPPGPATPTPPPAPAGDPGS